ncbi:helix-turn-helix domain-containing protein [Cellulosilyticum sp. I15G10I2]|uniref:helix-turn-helix domain-containing protein n=1 Tax=Cellulosilyticum sp. I15G10I2 TaxID=1892843 RepID=UPI00085C96F2|nr:helix-turn-helix domain-containing protein [Cellulosilyticum sp. I15G10I2]
MDEAKVKLSIMRYHEATEVTSHYIMFKDNAENIPCNTKFCEEFKRLTGKKLPCMNIKKYYCEQAARLGECYVYYCPIGFCHWIAPIISEGRIQGAVYGGPVLITDKQEYLFEELVAKNDIPLKEAHDLYIYLESIQQIKPQRVTALSEMLLLVSKSVSDIEYVKSIDHQTLVNKQQEELYQSINRIKENLSISNIKYSIDKEKYLLSAIEDLNIEETKQILNEILVELFASGGEDTDILITRILELVVILSKGALAGGVNYVEVFWLNGICMKEIFEINTIEELYLWLTPMLERFMDLLFKNREIKYADIIHKACMYIKENYMNKITLEDVAGIAKVTPNYLSKIFKESMGKTFTHYLNLIRIENSKKMLMHEDMTLEEIAIKSGFTDQSYFTKVFKKLMDISPKKYRQSYIRHSQDLD